MATNPPKLVSIDSTEFNNSTHVKEGLILIQKDNQIAGISREKPYTEINNHTTSDGYTSSLER